MSDQVRKLLDKALIYIGENLEKEITVTSAAAHACMSEFHFQRVFSTYLGESLSQYIVNRRLELAAKKLVYEHDLRITDIAHYSGFESHSNFSRAFKKQFDLSPKQFRENVKTAALGRDVNRPFLKTASSKYKTMAVTVEQHPTLWCNKKTINNGHHSQLHQKSMLKIKRGFNEILNSNTSTLFGMTTCCGRQNHTEPSTTGDDAMEMLYGAIYTEKQANSWSTNWEKIDSGLWAVCTHDGDYEYKYQTLNYVIRSWLPSSKYELRNTMGFAVHPDLSSSNKQDKLVTKLYIPIKSRKSYDNLLLYVS